MIRLRFTRNGRPTVLLGLDRHNVDRLVGGEPILVRGETVGVRELDIVICFGETLQALAGELRAEGLPLPPVTREPRRGGES